MIKKIGFLSLLLVFGSLGAQAQTENSRKRTVDETVYVAYQVLTQAMENGWKSGAPVETLSQFERARKILAFQSGRLQYVGAVGNFLPLPRTKEPPGCHVGDLQVTAYTASSAAINLSAEALKFKRPVKSFDVEIFLCRDFFESSLYTPWDRASILIHEVFHASGFLDECDATHWQILAGFWGKSLGVNATETYLDQCEMRTFRDEKLKSLSAKP